MIDFVVGLVEERADSGGSRFSESSLDRWRHAIVFTVECGTPGILKSMSSSLLFVLNDAISRCSSGACCSFTVHLSNYTHQVALIHREFAQHECFQTNHELQSR